MRRWAVQFSAVGPDGQTMNVEWGGFPEEPPIEVREDLTGSAVTTFQEQFTVPPIRYIVQHREHEVCDECLGTSDGDCPVCDGWEPGDGKPSPEQRQQLIDAGYFSWGFDAWIHEEDLGDVLTTRDALTRIASEATA